MRAFGAGRACFLAVMRLKISTLGSNSALALDSAVISAEGSPGCNQRDEVRRQ